MEHIIVGVDAGKTTAIACLSLDGRLLYAGHRTFAGMDWIIKSIAAVGTPSIIASDRRNPNHVLRKINAAFSARIYRPDRDIPVVEKRELARHTSIKDQHERDAYAAALKAYNSYSNKLKQAGHIAKGMGKEDIDVVRAKVIDRYSISEAISGKEANRG